MDFSMNIMKEGLSCVNEYLRKEVEKHKNAPVQMGSLLHISVFL
jgi:hypothetical protein